MHIGRVVETHYCYVSADAYRTIFFNKTSNVMSLCIFNLIADEDVQEREGKK